MKHRALSAYSLLCVAIGFGLSLGCSSDEDDGSAETGGAAGADGGATGGTGGSGGSGGSGATGGSGGTGGVQDCGDLGSSATCTACLTQNCCSEMAACDASNCKAYVACIRDCGDDACRTACEPDNFNSGAYNNVLICSFNECGGLVGTGGAAGAPGAGGLAGASGAAGAGTGGTGGGGQTPACVQL
jgi:hypothetical protein